MKRLIFLVPIVVFILVGLFVSNGYNFQFGFGTKGFIRKTLEKGQEEGKIPRTKEEKKEETKISYSGKVDKFDLREARYLFLAEKSTSTISQSPMKFSPVIYPQSSTGEKVIFKLKSDGKIEEVHIYDETGQNYFDVNVEYAVNVGTRYISVGLSINGVWVVEITTQVVNGSTQTVVNKNYVPISSVNKKKYLVRLEDGAVYEGEVLPQPVNIEGKDRAIVYEDQYGNFYFPANIDNLERVVKLNTKDMSYQVVSMQDDRLITGKFIVDKYGNFAYLTQINTGDGYKYRQTTTTATGDIIHGRFWTTGVYSNSLITTDESKEAIYFIEQPSSFGNVITKIECTPPSYEYKKSTMSFTFNGFQLSSNPEILDVEGKKVFIMQVLSTNNKTMFAYLDLETGTTNYYYEFDYKLGYGNYEVIGSSIVYSLYTPDQQNYKFYRIYPKEGSYEEIFSSNQYEIKSFYIDSNGYIIASGSRFSDGAKVMLKITPGNNTPEVLEELISEVYYLIRVY